MVESTGLLNRRTGQTVPQVRILSSPLERSHRSRTDSREAAFTPVTAGVFSCANEWVRRNACTCCTALPLAETAANVEGSHQNHEGSGNCLAVGGVATVGAARKRRRKARRLANHLPVNGKLAGIHGRQDAPALAGALANKRNYCSNASGPARLDRERDRNTYMELEYAGIAGLQKAALDKQVIETDFTAPYLHRAGFT